MKSQPLSVSPAAQDPNLDPVVLDASRLPQETNGASRSLSRLPRARSWSKRTKILLTLGLILVLGGAASGAYLLVAKPFQNSRTDLIWHKVKYGRLELTIVERGALESANNHDIVCRVKARSQGSQVSTTIKSVIDDGTQVKQGDLLVELDDSGLIEQYKTEKIAMDKAEADK